MSKIKIVALCLILIDLCIIYLKYYTMRVMEEDKISWKLIGLIQLPILIILCLFFLSFETAYIILIFATIMCIVLGFYLNYKGKKSATEPIEAEIIAINKITTNSSNNRYTIITTYVLTLKYIVNGVEYINKNTRGHEKLDDDMIVGNKIMIKYNPKNPQDISY